MHAIDATILATCTCLSDVLPFTVSSLPYSLYCFFYSKVDATFQSDMTYTNLILWKDFFQFRYVSFQESLMILMNNNSDEWVLLPPIGPYISNTIQSFLELSVHFDPRPQFHRIPSSIISPSLANSSIIFDRRDHWDYVYNVENLINTNLWRRQKRQRLQKFFKLFNPTCWFVSQLTPTFCNELLKFHLNNSIKSNSSSLSAESKSLCEFYQQPNLNLTDNISGIAIFVPKNSQTNVTNSEILCPIIQHVTDEFLEDNLIVGYSLIEILEKPFNNDKMSVIHIEKGKKDLKYSGIFQGLCYIEAKILSQYFENVKYMNREQDLGLESLRISKTELNPSFMIEKVDIILK
ncbi:hypothetical protein RCL1_002574 [Eukaryota sp. TZLM3-RCL]